MHIDLQQVRDIDRIENHEIQLYEAALMYVRAGIPVVPLRRGDKILPEAKKGVSYAHATTDEKTVEKWWGHGGKFTGYNIGIACGGPDGCFAIDIDDKNGKRGSDVFARLCEEFDQPDAPEQLTPNGGRHYLFSWVQYAAASTDKLGDGIDTRGGRENKYSSHIVAWPSHTSNGKYTWHSGGEVVAPPQWVTDKLGVPWAGSSGRGNENVGEEDEENQHSIGQITEFLACIDPNELDYEEWLQVGQSINSQHPTDEGLALWDQWSSSGSRYEPDECYKRWQGFDPGGPIRMGTLINLAKHHGWSPKITREESPGVRKAIDKYNKFCAVTMVGGKVKVAMKDQSYGGVSILSREDFKFWGQNDTLVGKDARGNPKLIPKCEVWLASEERNTAPRGVGFFPTGEFVENGHVNLWRGWGIEPKEGDWSLYNQHIHDIICDGNDELHTFVLDWMAHMLQSPLDLPGTAIVMSGIEGCGKGTLVQFVGQALGYHYMHVVQSSHLTGNFNSHLMDRLLIFADEVTYGGDRKVAGILKGLVTEKELVSEKKGYEAFRYENRSRLVVASNEDWFIPAGPESRRWLVLRVNGSRANDRAYFDALYDQMEKGGTAALVHDLLRREITSNLGVAPVTEALKQQRALYVTSGDPVAKWWIVQLQLGVLPGQNMEQIDGQPPSWYTKVECTSLYSEFEEWATHRKYHVNAIPTPAKFYKRMADFGLVRKRHTVGTSRPYIFIVPELEQAREFATAKTGESFNE